MRRSIFCIGYGLCATMVISSCVAVRGGFMGAALGVATQKSKSKENVDFYSPSTNITANYKDDKTEEKARRKAEKEQRKSSKNLEVNTNNIY